MLVEVSRFRADLREKALSGGWFSHVILTQKHILNLIEFSLVDRLKDGQAGRSLLVGRTIKTLLSRRYYARPYTLDAKSREKAGQKLSMLIKSRNISFSDYDHGPSHRKYPSNTAV